MPPKLHREELLRVELHLGARVHREHHPHRVDGGLVLPQHLHLLHRARLTPPHRVLVGLLAPDALDLRVLLLDRLSYLLQRGVEARCPLLAAALQFLCRQEMGRKAQFLYIFTLT